MMLKKILLIHGPNLNLLGKRDQSIYGRLSLTEVEELTAREAHQHGLDLTTFQSNHEGDLIDFIQKEGPYSIGIIINPGAFTHYSYAIHDALVDTKLPIVEVHLSMLSQREPWRRNSVTASACIKMIEGKKEMGYIEAVEVLIERMKK